MAERKPTRTKVADINNFSGFEIIFDGVVDLDIGVGVADSPGIMGRDIGDHVGAKSLLLHLQ